MNMEKYDFSYTDITHSKRFDRQADVVFADGEIMVFADGLW
jgi:hypothetical protein